MLFTSWLSTRVPTYCINQVPLHFMALCGLGGRQVDTCVTYSLRYSCPRLWLHIKMRGKYYHSGLKNGRCYFLTGWNREGSFHREAGIWCWSRFVSKQRSQWTNQQLLLGVRRRHSRHWVCYKHEVRRSRHSLKRQRKSGGTEVLLCPCSPFSQEKPRSYGNVKAREISQIGFRD